MKKHRCFKTVATSGSGPDSLCGNTVGPSDERTENTAKQPYKLLLEAGKRVGVEMRVNLKKEFARECRWRFLARVIKFSAIIGLI